MQLTPQYDLIFLTREASGAAQYSGELRSAAIDPHLSRDGFVPILLESTRASAETRKLDGSRPIEDIQLRSIEAFLRELAMVRAAVEADMTEARMNWLRLETCSVEEMWSDTIFSVLYLPTRELVEIEDGGPETVSQYSVVFTVGWDEEHGTRMLKFRDGVHIGFGLAGE